MAEFTFFVDAEAYLPGAGDLAATEEDLFEAGVETVDIPTGFGADLGSRIPVRVVGSPRGVRFYAALLGMRDPMQLDEMERVLAAAEARDDLRDGP